jgi:D-serine deaminase-like pyridoxal phosphate-dependent protein
MSPAELDVETPAVCVDQAALARNIARGQEIARRHGLALSPHVKTHKTLEIAALQMQAGACGLTAAKTDEALVYLRADFRSLTVAYPLIAREKLRRLLKSARQNEAEINLLADSMDGLDAIRDTAAQLGLRTRVFVKIDVGLPRCGLLPEDPRLLELVHGIHGTPSLDFAGLLSHAGHAYAAADADEVRVIARAECRTMSRVREMLEKHGYAVPAVSVGSTPTVLAADTFDGITEIRPGNYVFLDGTALRLGLATLPEVALMVLATIVSANETYYIVDAGSKVLSSDKGAHGTAGTEHFGMAFPGDALQGQGEALRVVRLSEEHGFVERGAARLRIGERIVIVPNHACPVVNLADELIAWKASGAIERWKVAARGAVH